MVAGRLVEIFASLQGEGAWLGSWQLFLRLAGCSLACPWCDTPASHRPGPVFRGLDGADHPNPVTPAALVEHLAVHDRRPGMLTITGGEPLEQGDFLVALAPLLVDRKYRLHLETAGVHHSALVALLPWLSHVSMDWKTASTTGRDRFREHSAFLAPLADGPATTAVKILVGPATEAAEVESILAAVTTLHPGAEPILQPLSAQGRPETKALARALELLERCAPLHPSLRLLPQVHPWLGLR